MDSSGRIDEAIAQYQKALELKPDLIAALNDLAWLRATCPVASFRNGAAAIELARRAAKLPGGSTPVILDTLAAAYAEAGMFAQARQTAREALRLAEQERDAAQVEVIQGRLRLYDAGISYRQANSPAR